MSTEQDINGASAQTFGSLINAMFCWCLILHWGSSHALLLFISATDWVTNLIVSLIISPKVTYNKIQVQELICTRQLDYTDRTIIFLRLKLPLIGAAYLPWPAWLAWDTLGRRKIVRMRVSKERVNMRTLVCSPPTWVKLKHCAWYSIVPSSFKTMTNLHPLGTSRHRLPLRRTCCKNIQANNIVSQLYLWFQQLFFKRIL